jgi:hypothetical protein
MPSRPVWFLKCKGGRGRKQVAVYVPNASSADIDQNENQEKGLRSTSIQVIGSPIHGFSHNFIYNCDPASSLAPISTAAPLGQVDIPIHSGPIEIPHSIRNRKLYRQVRSMA